MVYEAMEWNVYMVLGGVWIGEYRNRNTDQGIPVWLEYILTGIFIVLWMIFFCVEVLILCAMISVAPKNMKYIIILGAQISREKSD